MKKVILGMCLALPVTAFAEDFSYTYAEGAYVNFDGDHGLEGDGGALALSWAVNKSVYTKLDFDYLGLDGTSIDTYGSSLTIGGHAPLTDTIDMYLGVIGAYTRATDVPFLGDVDGYGMGAEIGLRAWLFPQIELDASVNYVDLFNGDLDDMGADTSDYTAAIDARYYATPVLSIGAGYAYAFDAESDTLSASLRYDF